MFLERTYNDYLLIILADHGMTLVRENIELSEVLESLDVTICVSHRAAHIYTTDKDLKETIRRLEDDKRFDVVLYGNSLENYRLKKMHFEETKKIVKLRVSQMLRFLKEIERVEKLLI